MSDDLEMFSVEELRRMLRFYRRGPLANLQCRQTCRRIIAKLRSRKNTS